MVRVKKDWYGSISIPPEDPINSRLFSIIIIHSTGYLNRFMCSSRHSSILPRVTIYSLTQLIPIPPSSLPSLSSSKTSCHPYVTSSLVPVSNCESEREEFSIPLIFSLSLTSFQCTFLISSPFSFSSSQVISIPFHISHSIKSS